MAALIHRLAHGQGRLPALALLGLLLVILVLMGRATTNSAQFGQMYSWLLLLSAIGLGALALAYPVAALIVTIVAVVAIVVLLRWLVGWIRRAAAPPAPER